MRVIVAPLTNELSGQFIVKSNVSGLGAKVSFRAGPVSSGVEGARKDVLSKVVGGDEATFNSVRDTPSSFCGTIFQIGSTESGQACKAVNQILCAGINQAVTEALAFGEDMDLDMTRALQVVTKGAAGNWKRH